MVSLAGFVHGLEINSVAPAPPKPQALKLLQEKSRFGVRSNFAFFLCYSGLVWTLRKTQPLGNPAASKTADRMVILIYILPLAPLQTGGVAN